VCGSTIEDYAAVTKRFDNSPIDAIEINISCPNIKEGGVSLHVPTGRDESQTSDRARLGLACLF
jgi:dihydroorotate dehydrogenase